MPVRRAWSSLDGEESKSTQAGVSAYSGQRPVPKAKCPSSRTDSLLYFQSHLPFSHPNSSKQDTEKQKMESIDNSSGCSWFFFLKGQWDTMAELNPFEPDSTEGLLKERMRQRWKHITEFLLISHIWACPRHFFFFTPCWKLSVTLLGSKDSLRLSWEVLTDFPKSQSLQRCRSDVP